ncbi:MAG: response regulator transcription factor [Solirubrobacterales bacterium]|nr:response regulator transcription factor [Solirubrobacterales bacterium]
MLFAARHAVIGGRRRAVYVVCEDTPGEFTGVRPPDHAPLTEREREVVIAIALGATSREIADKLTVSVETVRTHVRNAMGKYGARTRAHLVAMAISDAELLPELPHLEEMIALRHHA